MSMTTSPAAASAATAAAACASNAAVPAVCAGHFCVPTTAVCSHRHWLRSLVVHRWPSPSRHTTGGGMTGLAAGAAGLGAAEEHRPSPFAAVARAAPRATQQGLADVVATS